MNNFNSGAAILAGLLTHPIQRSKRLWADLSRASRKAYTEVESILQPFNNYGKYRQQLLSLSKNAPLIPFVAVLLKDFLAASETIPATLEDGSANPRRSWVLGGLLRQVLTFQKKPAYEAVAYHVVLYSASIKLFSDAEGLSQKSLELYADSSSTPRRKGRAASAARAVSPKRSESTASPAQKASPESASHRARGSSPQARERNESLSPREKASSPIRGIQLPGAAELSRLPRDSNESSPRLLLESTRRTTASTCAQPSNAGRGRFKLKKAASSTSLRSPDLKLGQSRSSPHQRGAHPAPATNAEGVACAGRPGRIAIGSAGLRSPRSSPRGNQLLDSGRRRSGTSADNKHAAASRRTRRPKSSTTEEPCEDSAALPKTPNKFPSQPPPPCDPTRPRAHSTATTTVRSATSPISLHSQQQCVPVSNYHLQSSSSKQPSRPPPSRPPPSLPFPRSSSTSSVPNTSMVHSVSAPSFSRT